MAAQVEAQVQCAYLWAGELKIVVSKSEMAAQAEAQVQCAYLWVGGLQIAGTWMGYG